MAVKFVDLENLTCVHSDCKEKLPFTSWQTLAYHVTIKHNRRVDGEIPCLICDFKTAEWVWFIYLVDLREFGTVKKPFGVCWISPKFASWGQVEQWIKDPARKYIFLFRLSLQPCHLPLLRPTLTSGYLLSRHATSRLDVFPPNI